MMREQRGGLDRQRANTLFANRFADLLFPGRRGHDRIEIGSSCLRPVDIVGVGEGLRFVSSDQQNTIRSTGMVIRPIPAGEIAVVLIRDQNRIPPFAFRQCLGSRRFAET